MNKKAFIFLFGILILSSKFSAQIKPIPVNLPDSIKTCASAEIHDKNMQDKSYARKMKRFEKSLIKAEKRKKRRERKKRSN